MNKEGHVLTMKDFTRQDLEKIFRISEEMELIAFGKKKLDILKDKIMAVLFAQPSTRTRLSFEAAMHRLGGSVIGFADAEQSRVGGKTQESLKDTIKMIQAYADVAVIRHGKDFSAEELARHSSIPVINGGDGMNEHPSQAILDLYTIRREMGRLDNLNILIWGHMGLRAIHSLCLALPLFDKISVYLYSPQELKTPDEFLHLYQERGLRFKEVKDIDELMGMIDVFYVVQVRRGRDLETEKKYVLDREKLKKAKKGAIILHPLPRTDELPEEVDDTPFAKYYEEAAYGVVTRMALLKMILAGEGN